MYVHVHVHFALVIPALHTITDIHVRIYVHVNTAWSIMAETTTAVEINHYQILKAGSQYDAEPCIALGHDALRNCEHCAMVKHVVSQCITRQE